MRHALFAVTPDARDRWLGHFRDALEEAQLAPEQFDTFWEYINRAAHFLVNTFDETVAPTHTAAPLFHEPTEHVAFDPLSRRGRPVARSTGASAVEAAP